MIEIATDALIRLPRHVIDVEVGGSRLITLSKGLGEVERPPEAAGREDSPVFLYQRPSEMGPEPWLVFVIDPTRNLAGNEAEQAIKQHEDGDYDLMHVGSVSSGMLWSPTNKLSLLSFSLSKKFMDESPVPHEYLLPKRVPAALRVCDYWQVWISL